MDEVGFVISTKNFLVQIDGLPSIKINDLITNDRGIKGLVYSLSPDTVEALILDHGNISPGEAFKPVGVNLSVRGTEYLLGRTINPLGVAVDGLGPIKKGANDQILDLNATALGIQSREFINEQFVTGVSVIDSLIPLGKGQRELIIGDPHSGKTDFLIDLIFNQKDKGVICIYACIGKSAVSVRNIVNVLKTNNALDHTIIVSASSIDVPPLIFLAPQTAFAIAEYYQKQGKDVLLILDDMGVHAKIYREISLLSGRAPGRESYPGDIFYQHSHLMERAGRFKKEFGGGSITALPTIESNMENFTTLIPTNLMSMTDGHLLFKSEMYSQGQIPSVDISLSVSRVGKQTQPMVLTVLAEKVRQVLAEAESFELLSKFSGELPFETRLILTQKAIIQELIKQETLMAIRLETQTLLMALVFTTYFETKDAVFVKKNKTKLIELLEKNVQAQKMVLHLRTYEQLVQLAESTTKDLKEVLG